MEFDACGCFEKVVPARAEAGGQGLCGSFHRCLQAELQAATTCTIAPTFETHFETTPGIFEFGQIVHPFAATGNAEVDIPFK